MSQAGSSAQRVMYPGSFDPIHLGHVDVIATAAELFNEVVVVVMHNHAKSAGLLSVEQRVDLATKAVAHLDGVTVVAETGLAVQAARTVGADAIVKGLRNSQDFEAEQQMAHNNHAVAGIRTVYVPCAPRYGFISSRYVREIAKYGEPIGHLVPAEVAEALTSVFAEGEQ